MTRTLLIPRLLIDPPGPAIPGQAVLIEDGQILAVGPVAELNHADQAVEQLPDQTLMPGLIDAHVHLELRPLPEDADVIRHHAEDRATGIVSALALTQAQAELRAGVTTVRDCASSLALLAVRRLIADGAIGPRIIACGPPITTTAGHAYWIGIRADDVATARRAARALCEHGVDAIKVMASGGMMTAGSNPSKPQFTVEELRAIVGEAERLGRRVVAHALNGEAIVRCVAAGVQTIDHARWNYPAGDRYDETAVEAIVREGTIIGLTASGWTRQLAAGDEEDQVRLRRAFAGHRQLIEHGAIVGVHSDAGGTATPFGRLAESLRVATVAADLSPRALLAAVTRTAAATIGLDGEIGSLTPGHSADLLVVAGNPLEDLAALAQVRRVYLRGRLVVEDGRLMHGQFA